MIRSVNVIAGCSLKGNCLHQENKASSPHFSMFGQTWTGCDVLGNSAILHKLSCWTRPRWMGTPLMMTLSLDKMLQIAKLQALSLTIHSIRVHLWSSLMAAARRDTHKLIPELIAVVWANGMHHVKVTFCITCHAGLASTHTCMLLMHSNWQNL